MNNTNYRLFLPYALGEGFFTPTQVFKHVPKKDHLPVTASPLYPKPVLGHTERYARHRYLVASLGWRGSSDSDTSPRAVAP